MRNFWMICALFAAVAGVAPAANARPLEKEFPPFSPACFMRDYDLAYLVGHPDQGVVQIMLSHQPSMTHSSNAGDPFYVKIKMMVRGSTTVYEYGAHCEENERGSSSLQCEPEWEAGSFSIQPGKNGAIVVRNNRMVFNPAGYKTRGVAQGAITLTRGDTEWELLPSAKCAVRRVTVPQPSADSSLPEEHYIEPNRQYYAPVQPEPEMQLSPTSPYPETAPDDMNAPNQ